MKEMVEGQMKEKEDGKMKETMGSPPIQETTDDQTTGTMIELMTPETMAECKMNGKFKGKMKDGMRDSREAEIIEDQMEETMQHQMVGGIKLIMGGKLIMEFEINDIG